MSSKKILPASPSASLVCFSALVSIEDFHYFKKMKNEIHFVYLGLIVQFLNMPVL